MNVDVPTLIAIGVPTVGGIVWLVRLEGRINTHDCTMLQIRDDLVYIRGRLDQILGSHRSDASISAAWPTAAHSHTSERTT